MSKTYRAIKHSNCTFSFLHAPHCNKRKPSTSIRNVITHNLHIQPQKWQKSHKHNLNYHNQNTPKTKNLKSTYQTTQIEKGFKKKKKLKKFTNLNGYNIASLSKPLSQLRRGQRIRQVSHKESRWMIEEWGIWFCLLQGFILYGVLSVLEGNQRQGKMAKWDRRRNGKLWLQVLRSEGYDSVWEVKGEWTVEDKGRSSHGKPICSMKVSRYVTCLEKLRN